MKKFENLFLGDKLMFIWELSRRKERLPPRWKALLLLRDKSKLEIGTTTQGGWQNAQKQLRQTGLNFSSYTFCQNLRQKIVQIGYLQIRRVGV